MKDEKDKETAKEKNEEQPVRLVVEEVKESDIPSSQQTADNQEKPHETMISEEKQPKPLTVSSKKENSLNKTLILTVLGTMLLTMVIIGGVLVSGQAVEKQKSRMAKPTSSEITPTPTIIKATPTPTINIADYKIQVLNGSGISGKAGELKKYLEGLGYKNIETGNAVSNGYKDVQVSLKQGKEEFKTRLNKDLSVDYTLVEPTKPVLENSSSFDVVIIVGK